MRMKNYNKKRREMKVKVVYDDVDTVSPNQRKTCRRTKHYIKLPVRNKTHHPLSKLKIKLCSYWTILYCTVVKSFTIMDGWMDGYTIN